MSHTVPSTRLRREVERRFLDVVTPFKSHELTQKLDAPEVKYHYLLFW